MWINVQSSSWKSPIIFKGESKTDYCFLVETGFYCENHLCFKCKTETSHILWIESTSKIEKNKWYHIAIIKDVDEIIIMINGLVDNINYFSNGDGVDQSGGSIQFGGSNFNLEDYFIGLIDEVYIFNRALNVSEVNQYYSEISTHIPPLNDGSKDNGESDPFFDINELSFFWFLVSIIISIMIIKKR